MELIVVKRCSLELQLFSPLSSCALLSPACLLYVKHSKGILLAIEFILYSQDSKAFLNCKQKNNWQLLFIEIVLPPIRIFPFFFMPKGWDCPSGFNCSFGGANWFILWNYCQCANWSFCLLTLHRDQCIDLPHRMHFCPTKCWGGNNWCPVWGRGSWNGFFYPSHFYIKSAFLLKLFFEQILSQTSCRKLGWLPGRFSFVKRVCALSVPCGNTPWCGKSPERFIKEPIRKTCAHYTSHLHLQWMLHYPTSLLYSIIIFL